VSLRSSAAAAAAAECEPTARLLYLHPGQLAAFGEPMVVSTILGSCVSVALYDTGAGVGGLNHFVLAAGGDGQSPRYAEPACEQLLARLLALGARPARLRAKLFGGGAMFAPTPGRATIGDANVAAARAWLGAQGIPIDASDVGGLVGRRLFLELPSGEARMAPIGGRA
jgi:chemotaxis protein CheD